MFTGEAGADTILDFRDGIDRIELASASPLSIADLVTRAVQIGDDVQIAIGQSETVTIRGLLRDNLDDGDFVL